MSTSRSSHLRRRPSEKFAESTFWMRSTRCSATAIFGSSEEATAGLSIIPQAGTGPVAGNPVDEDDDGEGEQQHQEAEDGDGAEIAALLQVEDQYRYHFCFRCEQDDRRR